MAVEAAAPVKTKSLSGAAVVTRTGIGDETESASASVGGSEWQHSLALCDELSS